jgi:hypothetical protein
MNADIRARTSPATTLVKRSVVELANLRILLLILLATAALDAGRFGWSTMPTMVRAIGTAAVVAAISVVY